MTAKCSTLDVYLSLLLLFTSCSQVGDGLPPMYSMPQTLDAMKEAVCCCFRDLNEFMSLVLQGFNVIFARDIADSAPGTIPW